MLLKKTAIAILLGLATIGLFAQTKQVSRQSVASAITTVSASTAIVGVGAGKTYQANGATTAGAGSATIQIQCSNNNSNWDTLGTITLTLSTTSSSNSFASDDRCAWIRANVTAISGTGASVDVWIGY